MIFRSCWPAERYSARALVKRHGNDLGPQAAATDVHFEHGPGRRLIGREIGHANRFLQERRLGTAGHDTGLGAIDEDLMPLTGNPAIQDLETDKLPAHALSLLTTEDVG